MEELWFEYWPKIAEMFGTLLSVEVLSPSSGFLGGLIFGLVLHGIQRRKARILPYLPSYSQAVNAEHDGTTQFYASVHDMTMCVTEAWNTKHGRTKDAGSVETQLHHDQLYRACEGVQTHSATMMDELSDYGGLAEKLGLSLIHI